MLLVCGSHTATLVAAAAVGASYKGGAIIAA